VSWDGEGSVDASEADMYAPMEAVNKQARLNAAPRLRAMAHREQR
jgi:hypothetical protein